MYTEQERLIFGPYCNGIREVYADPLRVFRRLHQMLEGEPNKFILQANSGDAVGRLRAKERLADATVYALELTPFDPETGKGVLLEQVEALLRDYLEFMEKKGLRGSNSLTSPTPTVLASSAPFVPTTPPTSLSGRTSHGCGCKGSGK
jgi:hypothetical protein